MFLEMKKGLIIQHKQIKNQKTSFFSFLSDFKLNTFKKLKKIGKMSFFSFLQ